MRRYNCLISFELFPLFKNATLCGPARMEGHDEKLLPTEPEDAKDVVLASDLPEPEKVAGVADLPRYPPRTEPTSRVRTKFWPCFSPLDFADRFCS